VILRHRKYRVSLAIAAAVQVLVFGGVLYLNCGTFDEPLSAPPCAPWLPPGFAALLPTFVRSLPWLAEPAARIMPAFHWVWGLPLSVWLQEWIPAFAVIALNLAFWTPILGTLFVGAEGLSKRLRRCSAMQARCATSLSRASHLTNDEADKGAIEHARFASILI